MTIQPATAGDLDAVRRLLRAVDVPHEDLLPAHLEHFFVVRDGDTVRGVGGVEPCREVALLRSLAVAPSHRGDGIGTRLTSTLERQGRDKGLGALYLLTTTASDYFRTSGYGTIDREALPPAIQKTEEAARLCPASATCMRKVL